MDVVEEEDEVEEALIKHARRSCDQRWRLGHPVVEIRGKHAIDVDVLGVGRIRSSGPQHVQTMPGSPTGPR